MHPTRLLKKFVVLAILILLAACARSGQTSSFITPPAATDDIPVASPTSLAKPVNTALPSPTTMPLSSKPPVQAPLPHYHVSAQLDYGRKLLKVDERVVYTNTTNLSIPDLTLDVEPNLYTGAFQLSGLHWGDGTNIISSTLEYNRLWIGLPQPLEPGAATSLSLSYTLNLPAIPPANPGTRPQVFGYTERQVNLVDWYAFFPPYQAERGWLIHGPWYYGEHQVYEDGDFTVEIQVSNAPPGLVAASSSLPLQSGERQVYQLDAVRSFAWSIGPEYTVYSQTAGTVTVLSYAFPYDSKSGQQVLKDAAAALELYSRLFGPYPHPSLSVVEADFRDGMEYDGLVFLSSGFYNLYDGTPRGYLTAITAHETAHQWWFGLVGNDQFNEPWLDESLATYSERLFFENIYPDLVDWWWATRVNFFQPQGPINLPVNAYNGYEPYRNAVYLHGSQFFEDLRKRIGDQAFLAFLKDYASQYAHRQATSDDFFALLGQHTQQDISDLKQAYFRPK